MYGVPERDDEDPLILELQLQSYGVMTGQAKPRMDLAKRLCRDGLTADTLSAVWAHCQSADEPPALLCSILRDKARWQGYAGDLKAQAQQQAESGIPNDGRGSVLECAHGRDRRRVGCHECDPHAYCEHHVGRYGCAECQPKARRKLEA